MSNLSKVAVPIYNLSGTMAYKFVSSLVVGIVNFLRFWQVYGYDKNFFSNVNCYSCEMFGHVMTIFGKLYLFNLKKLKREEGRQGERERQGPST